MLFDTDPEIGNMVITTITRSITSQLMEKKQFDEYFFSEVLYKCIGLAAYFLITKNLIPNNYSHVYMNNAVESSKKYGTSILVHAILNGTKIDNDFFIMYINTLIGYIVYHLVIEKYLDDNNIDSNIKHLVEILTKDIVVSVLSGKQISINAPDLIGIVIYNSYVKNYISF